MSPRWVKPVFLVAALYDGVLGIAVALFALPLFDWFDVTPPNHVGYVQFPALLLLIFADMFRRIAQDPVRNRSLIPYGIGLKVAYSALVFGYQLTSGVPFMWVPWAWLDLGFIVLFVMAWKAIRAPVL